MSRGNNRNGPHTQTIYSGSELAWLRSAIPAGGGREVPDREGTDAERTSSALAVVPSGMRRPPRRMRPRARRSQRRRGRDERRSDGGGGFGRRQGKKGKLAFFFIYIGTGKRGEKGWAGPGHATVACYRILGCFILTSELL